MPEQFDVKDYLPEMKRNKNLRKENRIAFQIRITKMLVYLLANVTRFSQRFLGMLFKKDKNTIKKWVEEVSTWSREERDATMTEIFQYRQIPNKDVHDLYFTQLASYEAMQERLEDAESSENEE